MLTLINQPAARKLTDFGAAGNGTSDDATALSTMLATDDRDIVIPRGTFRVASNLTIPATKRLHFQPGARLAPASGVTVTIQAEIDAPLTQIFTGDGLIRFDGSTLSRIYDVASDNPAKTWEWWNFGVTPHNVGGNHGHPGLLSRYHPEWWGALPNVRSVAQGTLNTAAINKLIAALPVEGGELFISGVLYTNGTIDLPFWTGDGVNTCIKSFWITGIPGRSHLINFANDWAIDFDATGTVQYHNGTYQANTGIRDLIISSQGSGVRLHNMGRGTAIDNVLISLCKGDYGLYATQWYGACHNLRAIYNQNDGIYLDHCNAIHLPNTFSWSNGGRGIVLDECTSPRGHFYLESNNGWAADIDGGSGLDLHFYVENNRRETQPVTLSGYNTAQIRVRNQTSPCVIRGFTRWDANHFDCDAASRAFLTTDQWPNDSKIAAQLLPYRDLATLTLSGGYFWSDSGYAGTNPETADETGWHFNIPIGHYNHVNTAFTSCWHSLDGPTYTLLAGESLAISCRVTPNAAAAAYFSGTDYTILRISIPGVGNFSVATQCRDGLPFDVSAVCPNNTGSTVTTPAVYLFVGAIWEVGNNDGNEPAAWHIITIDQFKVYKIPA